MKNGPAASLVLANNGAQQGRGEPESHGWFLGNRRATSSGGQLRDLPGHIFSGVEASVANLAPSLAQHGDHLGVVLSRRDTQRDVWLSDGDELLHGDLHHDNILAAGDAWLAIDPKGVLGEPAYEVGALLRNFWDRDTSDAVRRQMSARRVAILAETLGFDRRRIAGWGVAQAVLSAWWSYEDHGHGWEWGMAAAAALAPLL